MVEWVDQRRDYGEARVIAIGEAEASLIVVVYTLRGENRRIISARKVNSREKKFFENEIRRRRGARSD